MHTVTEPLAASNNTSIAAFANAANAAAPPAPALTADGDVSSAGFPNIDTPPVRRLPDAAPSLPSHALPQVLPVTDLPADTQDDEEVSLLDLVQLVVGNLRLLVLGPLLCGLLALGLSFCISPVFSAATSFLPPQQQQSSAASMLASLGALGGLAGAATGLKNSSDQYIAFLKSNSIKDSMIARFGLRERYDTPYKEQARKTLDNKTKILSGKDGLITVTVEDTQPQQAADMANAYVEELTRLLGRLAVTEAQQRRQFFEKQLQQVKEKLVQAELALKSTGVASSVLKANPASAVAAVAALQAQVTVQEVKLGAMRGYLAETAPDFKQALTELANLRAQLARESKDNADAAVPQSAQGNYVAKYREFKYQETLFELYAKQFEMAKVDESREGVNLQVLDRAEAAELHSRPQRALIVSVAVVGAGLLLLLFVAVRNSLRTAKQNEQQQQKLQNIQAAWRQALGRTQAAEAHA